MSGRNLTGVMKNLDRTFGNWVYNKDGTKDPRAASEQFLRRQAMSEIRHSDLGNYSEASDAEQESYATRIVEQIKFLLANFESADQLYTKEERARYERRHEIAKEEDRRAREKKRAELFASSEAAERWLFGVARKEYQDAKQGVEIAAQSLMQSVRAQQLIAQHKIDLFDFANRQIASLENERDRRREMWRIEAPIAVLLSAFAKPRVIDSSPQSIRKDPGDYMYRLVSLWFDAKFVRELPEGAYGDVLGKEHEYQQKRRDRTQEGMHRDSIYGFDLGEDQLLKRLIQSEKEREDRELRGYESARIAMLWWKCPMWLQWKILKPYIAAELRKIDILVRSFSGKQLLAHVDELIARENRAIKLQNTLLGIFDTGTAEMLDRYWKEIMEMGKPSDATRLAVQAVQSEGEKDAPTRERADAIIKASRKRIKDLTEMRDLINLDFVMSRAQRDAEIERQQQMHWTRWQIPHKWW